MIVCNCRTIAPVSYLFSGEVCVFVSQLDLCLSQKHEPKPEDCCSQNRTFLRSVLTGFVL